jgi:hypothetical protein
MVTTLRNAVPRRLPRLPVLACLLLASTLAAPLRAGDTLDVRSAGPELEALFWQCDYAVTTRPVDMDEGAACADITRTLRDQRFAGDFTAMLEWWKANKHAEHTQLALKERAGF